MANPYVLLSFSTSDRFDGAAACCRLLHVNVCTQAPASGRTPTHTHPFWQLEMVRRGPIAATWAGGSATLQAGQLWLIAPGQPHAFVYSEGPASWLSYKFEARGVSPPALPLRLPLSPFLRRSAAALADLTHEALDGRDTAAESGDILSAMLRYTLGPSPTQGGADDSLVQQVHAQTRRHQGRLCSVKQLANEMGYSPGYLSSEFHRRTGKALKAHLDELRARAAEDLLRYADLSITSIAAALGFPDVFSFSRFFKRLRGYPPRDIRR